MGLRRACIFKAGADGSYAVVRSHDFDVVKNPSAKITKTVASDEVTTGTGLKAGDSVDVIHIPAIEVRMHRPSNFNET